MYLNPKVFSQIKITLRATDICKGHGGAAFLKLFHYHYQTLSEVFVEALVPGNILQCHTPLMVQSVTRCVINARLRKQWLLHPPTTRTPFHFHNYSELKVGLFIPNNLTSIRCQLNLVTFSIPYIVVVLHRQ